MNIKYIEAQFLVGKHILGMFYMKIFKKLNYKEILQVDGAFAVTHVNYGRSPVFHGAASKNFAIKSRKNSLSSKEKTEDVMECLDHLMEQNKISKETINCCYGNTIG